jgi:signal transduction histidine kinase
MREHLLKSAMILTLTALLALLAAWRISRGITGPLSLLTEQARALADGSSGAPVAIASVDEVGELARDFNRMAEELAARNRRLLDTMDELDRSRLLVTGERNFMERVVNSISSGILPFSPDGILISVNSNGRALLGDGITAGDHYRQVFDAWPELVARIEGTVAGRLPSGRAPYKSGSGHDARHYDIGIFPIGENMEQGITVTIRDETEKVRMREEMVRMDRLASLGKLSAGIAHEIRNPLTGVTLLLDDLQDRPAMDAETRGLMGRALAEIERVEKLISSLLNYAAPPRSEFRTADLNELIIDTLLIFRKVCEKHGVKLESRLEELPPFCFDPEKIRQVLLNLLGNSLNASSPGGSITVASQLAAAEVVLTVCDNGKGIAANDLPLIFEPFFTGTSSGTGLGLSISQRIIEEHHGRIEVCSTAGTGTTITITLPLENR